VDGGVRNITPLSSAFAAEPDEIYVLLTSRLVRRGRRFPGSAVQQQDYSQWDDSWLGTRVGGLDVLKRTVGILTDEVYLDDVRGALDWNEVAAAIAGVTEASRAGRLPREVSQAIRKLSRSFKEVGKRHVPLYVLAPRQWYGETNDSTAFSPALIKQAIEHGQEIAADESKWVWPPK